MSENSAEQKAREERGEHDDAREEMKEFEQRDELPSDLKEWPDGKAKYVTFDNDSGVPYGEGLTEKLGPPVVHHDDGSVSVDGEKVDNPEDYKGDPIELATQVGNPDNVSSDESKE
jgi:hypothetical protein